MSAGFPETPDYEPIRPRRALTLPQPHASLVIKGAQTIVTWPRYVTHRGEVVIHAGAKRIDLPVAGHKAMLRHGVSWHECRRTSALLGTVTVVDCVPIVDEVMSDPFQIDADVWVVDLTHHGDKWYERGGLWLLGRGYDATEPILEPQRPFADFTPGRWALLLDHPVRWDDPVPWRHGRPGLWTLPDQETTP